MNFVAATSRTDLVLFKANSLKPKVILTHVASIQLPGEIVSLGRLTNSPPTNNSCNNNNNNNTGSSLATSTKNAKVPQSLFYALAKSGQLFSLKSTSLTFEPIRLPSMKGSPPAKVTFMLVLKKRKQLLFGFSNQSIALWSCQSENYDSTVRIGSNTTNIDQNGSITFVAVNCDESHVAVVVSKASITRLYIVSLTNNQVQHFNQSQSALIISLSFSHFKQSLLCCGYEDGSVELLDIFTLKPIKRFSKAHLSPVSAVQFSPFNRYLMVSVGLDKRYILYDVEKQKIVRHLSTPYPFSSLSVHPNGVLLGMTSLDGHLVVYDLTTGGKTPAFTFSMPIQKSGHATFDSASSHVEFMGVDKDLAVQIERAAIELLKRKSPTTVNDEDDEEDPSPFNRLADQSVNYMDVFSPISTKTRPLNSQVLPPPKLFKVPALPPSMPSKSSAVLAIAKPDPIEPLVDSKQQSPVLLETSVPDCNSKEEIVNLSNVESNKENRAISAERISDSPSVESEMSANLIPSSETIAERDSISPTVQHLSTFTSNTLEVTEQRLSQLTESIKDQVLEKLESITIEKRAQVDPPAIPTSTINNSVTSAVSGDFSKQVIRSIIDECLSDFRTELKSDVQNMHLELLRQFELQNQLMVSMLRRSCQDQMEFTARLIGEHAHPFMLQPGLYSSDAEECVVFDSSLLHKPSRS